jgi:hypothetical protein
MEERRIEFEIREETWEEIRKLATNKNVCLLSIIAPFRPERVAPRRDVFAELSHPEEFMIEEYSTVIREKFPNKDERPPLYILIHSLGGFVNSAYIIASILREMFNEIIAFVPHIAASGATLVAISANKIIMGNISQLSPIDPYFIENGKVISPKSIVTAFRNLDSYFRTTPEEDAAYPYKHFADEITPQLFDRSIRSLDLVERYAEELLEKAGYNKNERRRIIGFLVHETTIHEESIRYNKAKEIGLRVEHYSKNYANEWGTIKKWLEMYYMVASRVHIMKYALP